MIDQERVREMTKLAACEEHEGKRYRKAVRYYCSDFVGMHLLKGFISGTAVFSICLGLWGICHMEELIKNLDSIDFIQFGTAILVRYIFFLIIYLAAVAVYANVYHAAARRSMKRYYRRLKRLGRLYDEQEGHAAPKRHRRSV